jgi:uncharacterized protein YutE (UPF0331/DUF86 family)
MTIDRDLVTRKLLLVTADIESLGAIRDKGRDAYLANSIHQAVVERRLERAVGRMIDINYHLITASGHPPPSDYHASFLKLSEIGVLDPEFARRIARAAGLRNRLVHDYEDLDPGKVFDALDDALRDVPVYLARVNQYVKVQ